MSAARLRTQLAAVRKMLEAGGKSAARPTMLAPADRVYADRLEPARFADQLRTASVNAAARGRVLEVVVGGRDEAARVTAVLGPT